MITQEEWDSAPRPYETGLSKGVLYSDGLGIAWGSLIAVDESVSSTQNSDYYYDGVRLAITEDLGDFTADLSCFTYPSVLDGDSAYLSGDARTLYGLSYRVETDEGDEIHVVYNATFSPKDQTWSTESNVPNASTFDWDIQALAINVPGARPSPHLVIRVYESDPDVINVLEGWLYGTETTEARLPDPEEIIELFEAATTLKVTYNGDGSYTITGPDHLLAVHEDGTFEVSAPTAQLLDERLFSIQSF